MIYKYKFGLAVALLLTGISAGAQIQTKGTQPSTIITEPKILDDGKEVTEPYDGTYRFIFTKGKKQIFTDEIFKTIELNRKDDQEVTLTLSPYTKLNILSRRQIAGAGFMPYTKSYVFEKLSE